MTCQEPGHVKNLAGWTCCTRPLDQNLQNSSKACFVTSHQSPQNHAPRLGVSWDVGLAPGGCQPPGQCDDPKMPSYQRTKGTIASIPRHFDIFVVGWLKRGSMSAFVESMECLRYMIIRLTNAGKIINCVVLVSEVSSNHGFVDVRKNHLSTQLRTSVDQ